MMSFFEPSHYDPFGRSGYYGQQQPRYPAGRRNHNYYDDEDEEEDYSGYHGYNNRVPVRRAAPQPQRYYQEEEDEEEEQPMEEEEVDERLELFNKKKNYRYSDIPELSLESLSGNKGWNAQARLPRNLYNANFRLKLDGGDTLVICVVQRGSMFQEAALVPIAICYLPEDANTEKINASNQGGVLSIVIPKRAVVKAKPVKVAKPVVAAKPSKSKVPVQQRKQSPQKVEVVEPPKPKPVEVSKPMSPMTARKMKLQEQEDDVFERALKYAIPD